ACRALRSRDRAGVRRDVGAGGGLSIRRRHRERIGLHRGAVPQGRKAGVERGAALGPRRGAVRQDPAGAVRRLALPRHPAGLHRHAARHRNGRARAKPMTSNGGVAFAILLVVAAMLSGSMLGLALVLAVCLAFGAIEVGPRSVKALAWAAAIVAP